MKKTTGPSGHNF